MEDTGDLGSILHLEDIWDLDFLQDLKKCWTGGSVCVRGGGRGTGGGWLDMWVVYTGCSRTREEADLFHER